MSSFTAIGESLTAVTVIANVPVSVPPLPSLTVYVITGTVPFQLALGVKVYVPSAFTTIVPIPGNVVVTPAVKLITVPLTVTDNCVTDKVFPSASVSFVKTLPVAGVSSLTVFVLSVATGASLTAVTVIANVPVSVLFPSVIVYVITGTVPL